MLLDVKYCGKITESVKTLEFVTKSDVKQQENKLALPVLFAVSKQSVSDSSCYFERFNKMWTD